MFSLREHVYCAQVWHLPLHNSPKQNIIMCKNGASLVSGVTQEFCSGGGSTNSVEDRENGDLGGGSPLVRGSGGSCNLVQEISFHMVKLS